MQRTILVAVDVDDTLTQRVDDVDLQVGFADEDIEQGVRARLALIPGQFAAGVRRSLIPSSIRVYVGEPDGVKALLQAADIGLEGADGFLDPLDLAHAVDALDTLRGEG